MLMSLALTCLIWLTVAQFPPPLAGVKVIKSQLHENVTISYKEPHICETTPNVKSYSGYVHLPPGLVDNGDGTKQDYPINTFFWFFEARNDPENAPLAIWLNGGPGASSIMGLLQENGPCFVNNDSQTTYLNPLSWNNHVNMLYIDQPNQVGFSYDVPTNVTIDSSDDSDYLLRAEPADFTEGVPATNLTFSVGTLASQNATNSPSTTAQAAHAIWHFAQTFFFEFPHYRPNNSKIALWAESYGGHWAPGFSRFFQEQNEKIRNGRIANKSARLLHLDTLGIINGYIDALVREKAGVEFLYENTYGLKLVNESTYHQLNHTYFRPGGCQDQLVACQRNLKANKNRSIILDNPDDSVCSFTDSCDALADGYFAETDHNSYDIAAPQANPSPPRYFQGYLTQANVIQALGARINYTWSSSTINSAFAMTYDNFRGGFLEDLAHLLDGGVKVHLVYGDRDFNCNWFGGEESSLSIPYSRQHGFNQSGYTPLLTNGQWGGMTRQHGNLSFSRVFQSGHEVPFYQPEVAYEIFMRATFHRDIATGMLKVTDKLSTVGPRDVRHIKNRLRPGPKPSCYILYRQSCTNDIWDKVKKGIVTVKNFLVVDTDEESG